jgi:hypothetical protein
VIKELYVVPRRTAEQRMSSLRAFHWRHFYLDRRFLIIASLILVILVTYALTGDFTWHPRAGMVSVIKTVVK